MYYVLYSSYGRRCLRFFKYLTDEIVSRQSLKGWIPPSLLSVTCFVWICFMRSSKCPANGRQNRFFIFSAGQTSNVRRYFRAWTDQTTIKRRQSKYFNAGKSCTRAVGLILLQYKQQPTLPRPLVISEDLGL